MTAILLVHGAWHGAWCFEPLISGLADAGMDARGIDLPGHGADPADPSSVTFDDYVARVVEAVKAEPTPPVLVGHSMGGMVISAAAEAAPEAISRLVYLAAYLPEDGQSMLEIQARNADQNVAMAARPHGDGRAMAVDPSSVGGIFYNDCDDTDVAFAIDKLGLQPVEPMMRKVTLTQDRFGSVSRSYIECTDDRTICVALQREMARAARVDDVHTIEAGHSPFFSRVPELVSAFAAL